MAKLVVTVFFIWYDYELINIVSNLPQLNDISLFFGKNEWKSGGALRYGKLFKWITKTNWIIVYVAILVAIT